MKCDKLEKNLESSLSTLSVYLPSNVLKDFVGPIGRRISPKHVNLVFNWPILTASPIIGALKFKFRKRGLSQRMVRHKPFEVYQ